MAKHRPAHFGFSSQGWAVWAASASLSDLGANWYETSDSFWIGVVIFNPSGYTDSAGGIGVKFHGESEYFIQKIAAHLKFQLWAEVCEKSSFWKKIQPRVLGRDMYVGASNKPLRLCTGTTHGTSQPAWKRISTVHSWFAHDAKFFELELIAIDKITKIDVTLRDCMQMHSGLFLRKDISICNAFELKKFRSWNFRF